MIYLFICLMFSIFGRRGNRIGPSGVRKSPANGQNTNLFSIQCFLRWFEPFLKSALPAISYFFYIAFLYVSKKKNICHLVVIDRSSLSRAKSASCFGLYILIITTALGIESDRNRNVFKPIRDLISQDLRIQQSLSWVVQRARPLIWISLLLSPPFWFFTPAQGKQHI